MDAVAGANFVGGGSLKIGMNGGDGLSTHSVSLYNQDLGFEVPWDGPSTGRVPLRGDGMLSNAGLDAGSDKQCGLLSSCLDIRRSGIGVIPTGPDKHILC